MALLACAMGMLTSCDDHEAADNGIHVGYVLCSDHSCMSLSSFQSSTGKKAVGVVFAEKNDDHPILAVGLDEYQGCFCDSVGLENGTSGSVTAFDGYSNTVAMYSCQGVRENGEPFGCPIANNTFSAGYYGQSLYLPSVAEMRLLCSSARIVNQVLSQLGGVPLTVDGKCWYWTSTEVSGNTAGQAWLCSAANGGIQETPKTESHRARPILQLNYPEEP